MFSIVKNRFGVPGLIATIALVFAMTGGAFAAKYLITSTKQIKPSVLKKLKGATGPAGANGEKGATGAPGAAGEKGATGATGPTGAPGVAGSPWTAGGTLPSGETETGVYGVLAGGFQHQSLPFAVPLAAPLDAAHTKLVDGAEGTGNLTSGSATVASVVAAKGNFTVGYPISGTGIPAGTTITAASGEFTEENPGTLTLSNNATVTAAEVGLTEGVMAECEDGEGSPSGPSNPEADPGFLCVFVGSGATPFGIVDPGTPAPDSGAGTTGGLLVLNALSRGTYAVTAP